MADYAGIEARVLCWLAEDDDALAMFRTGADIYCAMAEDIYHRPITKADAQERQLGKAAILGCGYQMGGPKFVSTAALYGVIIEEDFSKHVVEAYRAKFWRTAQMWKFQEQAALNAVQCPGGHITSGRMTWYRRIDTKRKTDFLYCVLPSGRKLAYAFPQVKMRCADLCGGRTNSP